MKPIQSNRCVVDFFYVKLYFHNKQDQIMHMTKLYSLNICNKYCTEACYFRKRVCNLFNRFTSCLGAQHIRKELLCGHLWFKCKIKKNAEQPTQNVFHNMQNVSFCSKQLVGVILDVLKQQCRFSNHRFCHCSHSFKGRKSPGGCCCSFFQSLHHFLIVGWIGLSEYYTLIWSKAGVLCYSHQLWLVQVGVALWDFAADSRRQDHYKNTQNFRRL